MNARTTMSAKGQVVIPKDVRDRMGLAIGESFEVSVRGDEVMLRRKRRPNTISMEEAVQRLRLLYTHEGPPVPIEQLSWSPLVADPDAHPDA